MEYDMIFVCTLCGKKFVEITENKDVSNNKSLDQILIEIMKSKPSIIHRCDSNSRGIGSFRGIKRGSKQIVTHVDITE